MLNRLTRVLQGLLLLALLVFLFARFELWRVERAQQRVLAVQAAELDRQLLQLAIVPATLSDDPRVVAALVEAAKARRDGNDGNRHDGDARRQVNLLLERVRERSDAAVVYIMDRGGNTVAASNWRAAVSFVGLNFSFRPYFIGAVAGRESTFFGVGTTTGEPGYFIARPIRLPARQTGADRVSTVTDLPFDNASTSEETNVGEGIIGVVIVKVSLDALVDSWREQAHRSVVTDELGVGILSTDARLLYRPSVPIDALARARMRDERRYDLGEESGFVLSVSGARTADAWIDGARQLSVHQRLATEPWRLHLLIPRSRVLTGAALLALSVASVLVIGMLLLRLYRQQRQLAESEQRSARKLEELVARRSRELESAQRALIAESNFAMLGRMSAAINHEVNQPLASLRLDFATLRALTARDDPPLEDLRQTVVDGDRTIGRIARVVETLRTIARQGHGEFESLDQSRLLDDVVATVRRERPRGARSLSVENGVTGAPSLNGNAVLLQQALLNLLYNAFDAVAKQDRPWVSIVLEAELTGADPHNLCFRVADNGPGVEEALAEQLFEPFATSSSRQNGLGLGLTLARQIAEDHGGSLSYAARPNGGSEFFLQLPGGRPLISDDNACTPVGR